ncbi:hypothetical protein DFH06DRAFT_1149729 [Mycena polygramma]|nr:hypothetical protein DFH06DRAFT_1149729 [Mycena polygramma]
MARELRPREVLLAQLKSVMPRAEKKPVAPANESDHPTIVVRPFRFTGKCLEFLAERIAYFHNALDAKHPRIARFWSTIFEEYWAAFPWRLPVDVDPHPAMDVSQPGTHQEVDEKEVVVLQTQYRIKAFMFHQRMARRRMQRATDGPQLIYSPAASIEPFPKTRSQRAAAACSAPSSQRRFDLETYIVPGTYLMRFSTVAWDDAS